MSAASHADVAAPANRFPSPSGQEPALGAWSLSLSRLLLLALVTVPWAKLPWLEWVPPFKPADVLLGVMLLLWLAGLLLQPQATRFAFAGFLRSSPDLQAHGRVLILMLLLWVGWQSVAAVIGYLNTQAAGVQRLSGLGFEIGYTQAALIKLALLVPCLTALILPVLMGNDVRWLLRVWMLGLALAVLVHLALYLTPATWFQQRGGVFLEGNHAAPYYLASLVLARVSRRLDPAGPGAWAVWVAVLGVFLSQSTVGIGLAALYGGALLARRSERRHVRRRLPLALLMVGLAAVFMGAQVQTKLFGRSVSSDAVSRLDRLGSADVALSQWREAPLTGLGLQTHGFFFEQHATGLVAALYDYSHRRIVNNIYLEWLAEGGLVGLVLGLGMLLALYRCYGRSRPDGTDQDLRWTFWFMALSWLAFPSSTVSYQWLAMGVALAVVHSEPDPVPDPVAAAATDARPGTNAPGAVPP